MNPRLRRWVVSSSLLLAACGGRLGDGVAPPEGTDDPRGPSAGGAPTPASGETDPPGDCTAPVGLETVTNLADDGGTTTGRIVVDDRYLYVDTNRGTMRVRKCGGRPLRLANNDPGQYTATGFVQDAAFLYLASNAPLKGGSVRRIAKAGGAVDELVSGREAHGLALAPLDANGPARLYWIDKTPSGGNLRATRLDDGSTTTVATVPVALAYGPLLADAAGVTFFVTGGSNYGSFYVHPWQGLAMRGGAASPFEIVAGPVHDGRTVQLYFTFGHTGRNGVGRLPRADAANPAELAAESKAPFGLAQRDGVLYWSDMSAGTVSRCRISPESSRCDGAPELLATGEDDPRHLTTDETSIYWATRRGLLKRAPR
jgi:hypothetical protein